MVIRFFGVSVLNAAPSGCGLTPVALSDAALPCGGQPSFAPAIASVSGTVAADQN